MGARSKHFKTRELERRPNDLFSTQESQAGGFVAPPQLSGRCRSGNMGIRNLLVASGLRLVGGMLGRGGVVAPSSQAPPPYQGEQIGSGPARVALILPMT